MFKKLILTAVLGTSLVSGIARSQEDPTAPPVTRTTTTTRTNESSTLTTTTVDTDYEVDKRRDQGWNSPWALVFSFNNILVQGSFLSEYRGLGFAGALMLSEDFMIRGGATLSRTHTPPQTTETTTETAGSSIKTYGYTAGQTSSGAVTVRADALWRLTRNKVAPYIGGGPSITYTHTRQTSDDDVTTAEVVTSVRNRNNTFGFGIRGIVGAEWRIHSNFALFAEYAATLDILTYSDIDQRTTVTNTISGETAVSSTRTERNTPAWLNFNNALSQAVSLGLMVMF